MGKVEISPLAETDLENIWEYFLKYSIESAKRIIKELGQKFDLLSENPKIGRSHDEFVVHLRSFPHKKYVIFYFPIENCIEVYRVLHGARDIEDFFDKYFIGLKP
ncbi:MAG: type II toxin-antitoxin system RelE/ParE family toxin [Aridibacter sp.]